MLKIFILVLTISYLWFIYISTSGINCTKL